MIKVEFSLFSRVEWAYKDLTIIAESKDKALEILNNEFPLEFRYRPFNGLKEDSLKIECEVEADYFIL